MRKTLRALWISLAVLGSTAFFIVLPWALRRADALDAFLVQRVLWALAFLPGIIAVLNLVFGILPRRSRRKQELVPFLEAQSGGRAGGSKQQSSSRRVEEMEDLAGPAATIGGAFLLTAVFGVAAALSVPSLSESRNKERRPLRIGLERAVVVAPGTPSATAALTGTPTPPPTTPAAATAAQMLSPKPTREGQAGAAAVPAAAPSPHPAAASGKSGPGAGASADPSDPIDRSGGVSEGVVGLVFAAYGAYVYTMMLLVARINSSGVTGKFLLNSAIRTSIAMVLGYAIGVFGLFAAITNARTGLFLYFIIGLFPGWALDALRKRGRELLGSVDPACDVLPLCLIDGVDDAIMDRLAEVGIWDIQHLASADAPDVVMRTLFSLHRVLDWIDQAVLIKYVKTEIPAFRRQGVRSAIELLTIYGDATGRMGDDPGAEKQGRIESAVERKKRGEDILTSLSQKTSFSREALYAIGRSLYEDVPLNRIWEYWQYTKRAEDDAPTGKRSAEPSRT